jgi:glycosyltransferase involved in cell wall biosynthesis
MRIVLVSPLPPARDGIADYAGRLATAYREAGHRVGTVDSGGTVARSGDTLGALTWSPGRLWRLVRAVAAWQPDAVHVQHGIATYGTSLLPLWLFVAACRVRGISIVVTHHEVTRDVDRLGLPGRLYYGVTSRLAHVVHVHTDSARTSVLEGLRIPATRVLHMPHPVYPLPPATVTSEELAAEHGLTDRRVLLLFGFVHVEKGLREAVEGLGVLRRRSPFLLDNVCLVVAGDVRPRPPGFGKFEQADRDYLAGVQRRVSELELVSTVRFVGHVPDGEMAGWFALAEAALLPYTQSEQSGVANLAVAAGTPLLTSRTGGLGELFGAILPTFASLGPEDVADALEQHLLDQRPRDSYAAHYARIADDASPASLAERLRLMLNLPAAEVADEVLV